MEIRPSHITQGVGRMSVPLDDALAVAPLVPDVLAVAPTVCEFIVFLDGSLGLLTTLYIGSEPRAVAAAAAPGGLGLTTVAYTSPVNGPTVTITPVNGPL